MVYNLIQSHRNHTEFDYQDSLSKLKNRDYFDCNWCILLPNPNMYHSSNMASKHAGYYPELETFPQKNQVVRILKYTELVGKNLLLLQGNLVCSDTWNPNKANNHLELHLCMFYRYYHMTCMYYPYLGTALLSNLEKRRCIRIGYVG